YGSPTPPVEAAQQLATMAQCKKARSSNNRAQLCLFLRMVHNWLPWGQTHASTSGYSDSRSRSGAGFVQCSAHTTPQQTESRAARRAEASIVLANVLSAASVHGFQVDSGDAFFPDSEADAIWSASDIGGSGNVGGSLSIIEGAKIDNPQI